MLLLTDIVESTRLTAQLGDAAMARVWQRHDAAARALLQRHGGQEIDRTDGFLLFFQAADAAVAYAGDLHAALAALSAELGVPMLARVGVHAGRFLLLENRAEDQARGAKPMEIEGLAKPTAARVMGVAGGGHTLLTAPVVDALRRPPPLLSRGTWMFKGLPEPIELFEVAHPERSLSVMADTEKAWRVSQSGELWLPTRQIRHNLTPERDSFVGRADALGRLASLVDDGARLITLQGPGGVGKTRLARRFALSWLGAWPGGVWFCDLAEARDADDLVVAVAAALDVPPAAGDPVELLARALAGRGRALVILDNLERVLDPAIAALTRWMDVATDVTFLVTSRVALRCPGEILVPLDRLPTEAALKLFRARAQGLSPAVHDDPADATALARLMDLLDGLPLAIELAAARAALMSPQTLLARLVDRFALLRGGRGRNARHATLRATLDWSWDLLSPWEQVALAQLSVFEGSFELVAAESVLVLGRDAPSALELLMGLVDHSLLQPLQGGGRLQMLLSVREYAAEKLADAAALPPERGGAEAVARARRRHLDWYAALGATAASDGNNLALARREMAQLAAELPNLEAAHQTALALLDPAGAVSTWLLLSKWYFYRGPYRRILTLGNAVLALPGLTLEQRLRVLLKQARTLPYCSGDRPLREVIQEAAALAEQVGHPSLQVEALCLLGTPQVGGVRGEAGRGHVERALALARATGDRPSEVLALISLGMVHHYEEYNFYMAASLYQEAIQICRMLGGHHNEPVALGNLAVLYLDQGDTTSARPYLMEAVGIARQLGMRLTETIQLNNLGHLMLCEGDAAGAIEVLTRATALAREVGNQRDQLIALLNLGEAALFQGALSEADAHLREARHLAQTSGDLSTLAASAHLLIRCLCAQGKLEEAAEELALAERNIPAPLPPMEAALRWLATLDLALGRGDPDAARDALAQAEASLARLPSARGLPQPLVAELAARRAALMGEAAAPSGSDRA